MASKIFLDANVILEYILERRQANIVDSLFVDIEARKYKAYTSASCIQICSYWIEKAFGTAIAKALLLNMLNNVLIVDSSHEYVVSALHSSMGDIEDALQYYTALQHKMDYFITLDKKLAVQGISSLPVYLPGKFLEL